MAYQYQPGLLQTIAYLMGERTVNSTTSTSRADFLQKTLSEAYQAYPWKFAHTNATLSISSGIATLPTAVDYQHAIRAYFYPSGQTQETYLEEIDAGDKDRVAAGSRAFWLNSNGDGTYNLQTKDTDVPSIIFGYQSLAPTLDTAGTVGTPYPNAMTLALGARRFVKLGQNPDADISQDQALFKQYLNQDIAAEQIPHARKRRNTRQRLTGRSTGDF